MDFEAIDSLRDRHPAWRLLRAGNAALVLSFLGQHFVERNQGATSASSLASVLDDALYALNTDAEQPRFSRSPLEYLDDWSEAGWLRRFYPPGSDEVHFDALPSFERACAWVSGLGVRSFVGTESRLQAVIELLRQIVHGTESDPQVRLAELHRRRAEIDQEIDAVEAGNLSMLDATALRDRYQLFASTARDLLSDFREVEENFRGLDRTAREQIALWGGSKGDLLTQLVGSRADIGASDQGRSFHSFYDFLLSETPQDRLSALPPRAAPPPELRTARPLCAINPHCPHAADRTRLPVRQLS